MRAVTNIYQGLLECRRRHRIEKLKRELMNAVQNLQSAVSNLSTVASQVVTVLGGPNPAEAQIQAAADAVNSISSSLSAALPAASAPAVVASK